MKPLKISIKAEADDHFIYKGYIFIALSEGGIVAVSIDHIYEMLIRKYPHHENLIKLGFRRNQFWNSDAAKCFLGIEEVVKGLKKAWSRALREIEFSVSLEDLYVIKVCPNFTDTVLHMEAYANRLYLACLKGFYSVEIGDMFDIKNPIKRFDAKTYHISVGYGEAILSFGNDGFTNSSAVSDNSIDDKNVREGKSFTTNWTKSGGLMNYIDNSLFQFVGNRIKQVDNNNRELFKSAGERFVIEDDGFATNIVDYDQFKLRNVQKSVLNQFALTFNNAGLQFFVTKRGNVFSSIINVKDQKVSGFTLKKFPIGNVGLKPISGQIVANRFPIVEFDEKVVLLQDKAFAIEDEAIISMHTYPRSLYFRDLVTITASESINLHAIDLFDQDMASIMPKVEKKYHRRNKSLELVDNHFPELNFEINNEDLDLPF